MLQILIAVLAGAVTIAAPCILPLLPILLGASVGKKNTARPLFIVLGFIVVFSFAGVMVSFVSRHLGIEANTLRIIALVVLALFGLTMVWSKPLELLSVHLNSMMNRASIFGKKAGSGNAGGFVLGMTLGLVWTPCAGPVLGSILALIASQSDLLRAGILLTAYATGAAVPMLVIAYGGQYVTNKIKFISRYATRIQQFFGIVVIGLAIAMYFNYDTLLYQYCTQNFPILNPIL